MSGAGLVFKRSGMTSGAMLAGVVCLLALPSAVLAFSSSFERPTGKRGTGLAALPEVTDDPSIESAVAVRSLVQGQSFRFTPAGMPTRPDRSVTVAVRVDARTVREITVRAMRQSPAVPASVALGIAPTGFNLGVARGYHTFAQSGIGSSEGRKADAPEVAAYNLGQKSAAGNSRLSPRISFDERPAPGRAPRTFGADGDDRVDVGGALRVTRNLNVTAGVRYSQERDRLRPVIDGNQDNQAVYVGTQFRF